MLSSCAYLSTQEDWEKNGRVRLLLNWENLEGKSSVTWYFYKDGAEHPIIRTGDASGYEGTLPAGQYSVAICNTDYTGITLDMDNGYANACGMAQPESVVKSLLKSSPIQITSPSNLYGCGCEKFEVDGSKDAAKELYPVNLVRTLDLNIKIMGPDPNEEVVLSDLSGRLTGVSSRIHIPTGEPLFDPPATIAFIPSATESGTYASSVNLFGLSDGGQEEGAKDGGPVDLSLTMTLPDGKKVTSSTEITREVNEAFVDATMHVILDLAIRYDAISGMTLTLMDWKPGNNGSGVVDP